MRRRVNLRADYRIRLIASLIMQKAYKKLGIIKPTFDDILLMKGLKLGDCCDETVFIPCGSTPTPIRTSNGMSVLTGDGDIELLPSRLQLVGEGRDMLVFESMSKDVPTWCSGKGLTHGSTGEDERFSDCYEHRNIIHYVVGPAKQM